MTPSRAHHHLPESLCQLAILHLLHLWLRDLQCGASGCLHSKNGVVPAMPADEAKTSGESYNVNIQAGSWQQELHRQQDAEQVMYKVYLLANHSLDVTAQAQITWHSLSVVPNALDLLEAWQADDVLVCDIEVRLVCHCLCHGLDAAGHLVYLLVKNSIALLQDNQGEHKQQMQVSNVTSR